MSYTQLEELKCPFCGKTFVAELWGTVNVSSDPDLKEALLGGVLNVQSCPECGNVFYAERFVLYHDPSSELMAFVYPEGFAPARDDTPHREEWHTRMMKDFTDAQSDLDDKEKIRYKPELFFGLESLCRLIRLEEELEDEVRVIEYECRTKGIKTLSLSPSAARRKKIYLRRAAENFEEDIFSHHYYGNDEDEENLILIPRVIPLGPDKTALLKPSLSGAIQTLETLIGGNPAFRHYHRFLNTLKKMSFEDFEKIISSPSLA